MKHRRLLGAALAALCLLMVARAADAHRARHVAAAPDPVGYMVDDCFPHLRMPEAVATARAWPHHRRAGLSGVAAPLAAKANEIVSRCGSRIISGVRRSFVAGTRLVSL